MGIFADRWDIEEMGRRIWLAALYLRHRAGRYNHPERTTESQEIEGAWKGISLEYWHLSMTGTYMRHRWMAPRDRYEELICGDRHHSNPENMMGYAIGDQIGTRTMGGGTQNPLLRVSEKLIRS